ncbi:hypothetical protein KC902_00825 [Candidatus Kaiserbacteria bacterium]|nr:hypothetical protein [Candidatus Kaiserbacteria bacterium]
MIQGSLAGFVLALFFVLGVSPADAKSEVVPSSFGGVLYYQATASNWTNYWFAGLGQVDVYVKYNANVYDATSGDLIPENGTVSVGTKLRFEPTRGEISWNGVGYTSDTPFGQWVPGAARPGLTGTQVVTGTNWSYTFRTGSCAAANWVDNPINPYNNLPTPVYIPFSVNPETMTVDLSGSTAGLNDLGGNVYEVTAPGSVVAQFVYDPTFGRFYYEYISTTAIYAPGSCFTSWDLRPMSISGSWFGFNPTYNHPVPGASISYNITVADAPSGNNPPETPVITGAGANSHLAGEYQNFTIVADDLDGDALSYRIDWDNNGSVDQWVPSSGYVVPNVPQGAAKKWLSGGTYSFKAKVIDVHGAESGWGTYTIKICDAGYVWDGSACQPPLPDLTPYAMLHPSTVFNSVTGIFDIVVIEYWAKNVGGNIVTDNFINTIALDRDNDGSIAAGDQQTDPMSDNLNPNDESGHHILTVATNVPAGDHVIKINLDTNDDVTESSELNNDTTVSLNPIVPTLTLTIDDDFVRFKTTTTLHWTVDMVYLSDCSVVGPGVNAAINPSVVGGSGDIATGLITAKSEYVFSCTVPGGSTYTATATVETTGSVEEI